MPPLNQELRHEIRPSTNPSHSHISYFSPAANTIQDSSKKGMKPPAHTESPYLGVQSNELWKIRVKQMMYTAGRAKVRLLKGLLANVIVSFSER